MYSKSEEDFLIEQNIEYNWYDKYFNFIGVVFIIGSILFLLVGGSYCELAPGAPYC